MNYFREQPLKCLLYQRLTAGVSVEASGGQLGFCGVTGGVRPRVQSGERLKHAQNAVGRGELQVFLRNVAHQTGLIPCLETLQENMSINDNARG